MPHREIEFLAGQYYHICNRGVNRIRIFFCEENYPYLLRLLQKNVERYEIWVVACCLLPNHFHLIVRPKIDNNLSIFMKSIFGSYTQAVNKQQSRVGPLFQSRFRAILIDKEDYLLYLARYVHRNPVEAGLLASPELWPYSNYLDVIGHRGGELRV